MDYTEVEIMIRSIMQARSIRRNMPMPPPSYRIKVTRRYWNLMQRAYRLRGHE